MNKLLKIALIVIAVLIAIVVLPIVALVTLVDPNSFKPQIIAAVKEQTGREFRIDGKLGWTFYPVLGIELGRSELGNAQGFGDKPMLAVQRVAVGVELLPLLERELNVAELRLEQPQINLATDSNGRTNWDDILERQQDQAAADPASPAPAKEGEPAAPPLRIAVSGIEIVDGSVNWSDASTAQNVQVSKLNLQTGAINPLKPVDVTLSLLIHSTEPALDADTAIKASVQYDAATQALTMQQTDVKINLSGKDIPAGKQTLTLTMNSLALDLDKQTLVIPSLYAGIAGAELKASVDGLGIVDKPQFSGQLSVSEVSLRKLLGALAIELPEMADAASLGKFVFGASYAATPDKATLSQINMKLDDSTITGLLEAGLGDVTRVRFDLALDGINADRYLPPPSQTPPPAQGGAAQAAAAADDSETFAALDTLALNGSMKIGKLRVQNLDLSNVELSLKTAGRTVVIDPLKASLYRGNALVKVNVDGRGKRAQSKAAVVLLGMEVGDFLDAFLQERGPMEGNGNIYAEVAFSGLDGDAILSTATGTGKLLLNNGAVRGINIAQEIRNAIALVKQQPRQNAPQKTDLTELLIPFSIDKGVLSWKDMSASSPLLRIGSKGDFNLLTQQVDTTVDASVVSTLKGQGGEPLSEVAGFLVPVRVRGSMDDPKISIDIKKVLAQTALGEKQKELEAKLDERKEELKAKADEKKEEAKQKVEEKKEEARKKAGEELKRGLDKLLKKKD